MAMLVAATLCWAGNHVVARAIADEVPPASLNVLRWLLVALLVGSLGHRSIAKDWATLQRSWRVMTALGICGGGIFGTLQYVGLQFTTVVNMAVFNSVAPPLITFASWLIFRDRLRPVQWLGIAVSLAGVLAIISRLDNAILKTMTFNRGDLIIVSNMLLWALYSAYLRWRPNVSIWSFLFALSLPAALINVPFAIYEHASGFAFTPTPIALGATVYAALFTSILGYVGWSRGVEALGPGRAGVFLHLIAVFGAILGTVLFDERLQLYHALGFALILSGVVLTAWRRPAPPTQS